MARHLYYFRPGEEARMLARCQFGLNEGAGCGATFTYPIKGYPWRKNVRRTYEFKLNEDTKALLFSEVKRIRAEHSDECLPKEELWSDRREVANGITRDRASGTLCYTVGIFRDDGSIEEYFAIRENSPALRNSPLYKVISSLLEPYENPERAASA